MTYFLRLVKLKLCIILKQKEGIPVQKEKELMDLFINSPLGNVPFSKAKLLIITNLYLSASEKGYLDVPTNESLIDYCNETNSYLSKTNIKEIRDILDTLTKDELKKFTKFLLETGFTGFRDFSESLGDSLIDIVEQLLNIDGAGHIVVDLGSGSGNVLRKILIDSQNKKIVLKDLIGYEINIEEAKMSQMVLDILSDGDTRAFIKIGNAFDETNLLCTRGYCFPPFGVKQFQKEMVRQSRLFNGIEFTNRNTPEWLFVDLLLSGLDRNGRAVAIVSGRALFNFADEEYRKALIKSGLLEGIIELPNGSLNFTGVKPYILVFSNGNKQVKLLDASNMVEKNAKRFYKVDILSNQIIAAYQEQDVPTRDIGFLKNINNLVPSNVLLSFEKPHNGVLLEKMAKVFTGNQYTLGVFRNNQMLSDEPTGYRILTSSDIEDGYVDWKSLHSIKYEDNKFDKYAVKKNDIVVTSKSSKVKTVVVDIEPKEKILVTGGMLIIRPDINVIDPTYLKIYLDSEQGQSALKSIQKGSVIVTINSKELSKIYIPVIDIDKQKEKALRYNEKLSTLYALKQEARKLEDSLKNFYLDESEEE